LDCGLAAYLKSAIRNPQFFTLAAATAFSAAALLPGKLRKIVKV
jgi:hypothetical protein